MKTLSRKAFEMMLGALVAATTCSCSTALVEDAMVEDEFVTPVQNSRTVSFGMQTTMESMSTRAVSTATPTQLLVLDAAPDGTVKVYTRNVSADTDVEGDVLDNLSLNLLYGQHKLYFVAADNAFQRYDTDAMTVTWDTSVKSLKNCWAQSVDLTVGQEPLSGQQISLPIRVAQIQMVLNEGVISGVSEMELAASDGSWELDLNTMSGTDAAGVSAKFNIPSNYWNVKGTSFNLYSFLPEQAETVGTLTATARDANSDEVTSHVLNDVPAAAAQITRYTGFFFNNSQGFTLSVDNVWTEDNHQY